MFIGEERKERPVANLIWVDAHGTNDSHAELRTSGQLSLLAGAYACGVGCGTVILMEERRPLPTCPRCLRRTTWLRQRQGGGGLRTS
jgi:hypothetical protein